MTVRERMRQTSASIPRWGLLLFALSGILMLIVRIAVDFPKLGEAGYPDSYMLYDALHFQRTGVIYRDPATPPFPPAIYSPMFYVFVSIPGRIFQTANPFLGPRILFFLTFIACVVCVASITRALIPLRSARIWGFLLAASIGSMAEWVLHIRSDFPGIAFSLLSIRLALARGKWTPLLAGAAAGMAFQFKITFVAAAVAGALWLMAAKRWRDLMLFTGAGAVVGFALYGLFELREPQTINRLLSINLSIRDYGGLLYLVLQCATEPVFILAIAALPFVIGKMRSGWGLVNSFALLSLGLATVTAAHAGGNINYFFEALFALVPLAALGTMKVINSRWRWGTGSLAVAVMLTLHSTIPTLRSVRQLALNDLGARHRAAERRPFEMFGLALPGHSVLSTVPRISLIVDSPLMIEPYFLAYSQRLGRFDSTPIRARIHAQEFEAVVTSSRITGYRGVPAVPPDISAEIARWYFPYCIAGGDFVVHFPRGRSELSPLALRLKQLGCTIWDTSAAISR